ncbi:hypothetical protein [Stutzerimonas stutzeri]|uniref:Uncharacterized protein n=1 Tax=Stutzerimonas stutzeri TaxID=316 RepID=A0AA42PEE6_STUST|nr:hypothetical protein [Stutzerimonas stutzeri]MDH1238898.1 hypothetical protein [Stutzerimonas stutzeri]
MLHVPPQPEPASFDKKVRRPGLKYLHDQGIDLHMHLAKGTKIKPYWLKSLDDLYERYDGVCAYLAIHFERITGAGSVDHFAAKSRHAGQAYEWTNYRLACLRMNSRKNAYEDVLDPFEVENGWIQLELITGHIYPNPELGAAVFTSVRNTIKRLKLDDEGCQKVRARHYSQYVQGDVSANFLKRHSPFVWYEANRQGLL